MTKPIIERKKIRATLRDHHGAQIRIAEALGIKPNTISMWLAGGPNSKLDAAIPPIVKRLKAGEPIEQILKKRAA